MSPRRSLFALFALATLLLLAFPLLVSIFSDLAATAPPSPSTETNVAFAPVLHSSVTPTASSTATPTLTPTATYTATPTPTATSTPSPTATATPTPTLTPTPTATPLPRVYLEPFVQVFAVGQSQLSSSTQVLMYDGGADVFEVLGTQGTFTRIQTLDGGMNLWTAGDNISPVQPPAAQYDYSVKGRTALLASPSVLACVYNDRPTLAFGACQQMYNVSTAVLNARVIAGATPLYIAQISGTLYVISANAVQVQ